MKDILLVGMQFILFSLYLFRWTAIDFQIPLVLKIMGAVFTLIGSIFATTALFNLNTNLSPYPSPKAGAKLIKTGAYRFARHPIYSGILFFCLGYGLFSANTLRLLIFLALLILFTYKARYEEQLLEKKYPEYISYKKNRGMFLPKWSKKN